MNRGFTQRKGEQKDAVDFSPSMYSSAQEQLICVTISLEAI